MPGVTFRLTAFFVLLTQMGISKGHSHLPVVEAKIDAFVKSRNHGRSRLVRTQMWKGFRLSPGALLQFIKFVRIRNRDVYQGLGNRTLVGHCSDILFHVGKFQDFPDSFDVFEHIV